MDKVKLQTFTEFGKLNEVVVGRELQFNQRIVEATFKAFYKKNLRNNQFSSYKEYSINSKLIDERNQDLDGLAKTLSGLGVKVKRPDVVGSPQPVMTPTFKSFLSSASNVRDTVLTYGNMIIETPPLIQGKYFENTNMHGIFKEYFFKYNSVWVKAPSPLLVEESFDDMNWDEKREFEGIEYKRWDMGIDGAQYLKIGKDLLCNISTYNHFMGKKWVDEMIRMNQPEVDIHTVDSMVDNHLDGNILPLRPGVFLVNESSLSKPIKDYLPEKFRSWDVIKSNKNFKHKEKSYDNYNTPFIKLASYRGMDMNVLSVNERTVLVNSDALIVQEELDSHGFEVIPVQLRHCELFGGGIHCSTLDISRDDEFRDYTN